MTPDEFRAALEALGMTAASYARVSGRSESQVKNWTRKNGKATTPIPREVADWLRWETTSRVMSPAP